MQGVFKQGNHLYTIHTLQSFADLSDEVAHPAEEELSSAVAGGRRRRSIEDPEALMIIYRNDELQLIDPTSERCGVDGEHLQSQMGLLNELVGGSPVMQSMADDALGQVRKRVEAGCPSTMKMIFMGFAADCTYYGLTNSDSSVTNKILGNVNQMSAVFEDTFNFALGVVEIHLRAECGGMASISASWNEQCSSSLPIVLRLSRFAYWRGGKDTASKPQNGTDAGLWQLFSNCPTLPTVGIAWLNTLCQVEAMDQQGSDGNTQWVAGVSVSTAGSNEWLVAAHEIGHNLGSEHDCISDNCPCTNCNCCKCADTGCDCNNRYIMNPTSGSTLNEFSPCTQAKICSRTAVKGTCLGGT